MRWFCMFCVQSNEIVDTNENRREEISVIWASSLSSIAPGDEHNMEPLASEHSYEKSAENKIR